MVARKKYHFLCYILSIALVLSPCTKVLACPPDCSDEEAAVEAALLVYAIAVEMLSEALENLEEALEAVDEAYENWEDAKEWVQECNDALEEAEAALGPAQQAVTNAEIALGIALVVFVAACKSGSKSAVAAAAAGVLYCQYLLDQAQATLNQVIQNINTASNSLKLAEADLINAESAYTTALAQAVAANATVISLQTQCLQLEQALNAALQALIDCESGN